MDKCELLEFLDLHEHAEADDLAQAFELTYSAAAMALIRLVRQDLAARCRDPDTQLYVYNRALGRLQGYAPPTAFLLGRGWKQTVRGVTCRGTNAFERLCP